MTTPTIDAVVPSGSTFDANIYQSSSVTVYKRAITIGSGADRALIVSVSWLDLSNNAYTISQVNFGGTHSAGTISGGTDLTAISGTDVQGVNDNATSSGNQHVALFKLMNPASGAGDIHVKITSTTGPAFPTTFVIGGMAWSDCQVIAAGANNNGLNTQPSVSVTSATGDIVLGAMVCVALSATGTGNTARWNVFNGAYGISSAGISAGGAASVNLGWTGAYTGANYRWVAAGVNLSSSAGTSVALSGVQATGQAGSLAPSVTGTQQLTGVQASAQAGTLTPYNYISVPLTGVQASFGVGSMSPVSGNIITMTMVDAYNVPIANLTGLKWSVLDRTTLAELAHGSGATTDSSGVLSVNVGGSVGAGATVFFVVTDSDGTVVQNPPAKSFAGVVVVGA